MTFRPRRSGVHVLVALVAGLALFAAACGSDSDSGDSADSAATEEATEEATEDPTEEATEEATAEATEEATEEATPEPTEVELTDSAPGVTAEVIRIGVPVIDTTSIGSNPSHDPETIWQAAADTINADGGVLGRQIELVMTSVDPVAPISQEEACVILTEDEEVFAAVGVFQDDLPLCYTELEETIAVSTFQAKQEHFDRAVAPYIAFETLPERAIESQVATLLESGELDGKTVVISANRGEEGLAEADSMKAELEDAGIPVVAVTQFFQPSSDQQAIDAEFDVLVEAWRTAGADTVIALGTASVPTTGALSRNAFDVLYIINSPTGTNIPLLEGLGYNTDGLGNAIAVVPPSPEDMYEADIAHVKECVDNFDAAYDDDAPVEIRPEDETTTVVPVIVRTCQALELFKLVAELAGPDLTQESFDAAADELGDTTDVTAVILGSLGPGKRDFIDAGSALYRFDVDQQLFVLD